MAGAKIVVIYPRPTDVDTFERLYVEDHGRSVRDDVAKADFQRALAMFPMAKWKGQAKDAIDRVES